MQYDAEQAGGAPRHHQKGEQPEARALALDRGNRGPERDADRQQQPRQVAHMAVERRIRTMAGHRRTLQDAVETGADRDESGQDDRHPQKGGLDTKSRHADTPDHA